MNKNNLNQEVKTPEKSLSFCIFEEEEELDYEYDDNDRNKDNKENENEKNQNNSSPSEDSNCKFESETFKWNILEYDSSSNSTSTSKIININQHNDNDIKPFNFSHINYLFKGCVIQKSESNNKKRKWTKSVEHSGNLKRWRIRSLDSIFKEGLFNDSGRVSFPSSQKTNNDPEDYIDEVADIVITVHNNDKNHANNEMELNLDDKLLQRLNKLKLNIDDLLNFIKINSETRNIQHREPPWLKTMKFEKFRQVKLVEPNERIPKSVHSMPPPPTILSRTSSVMNQPELCDFVEVNSTMSQTNDIKVTVYNDRNQLNTQETLVLKSFCRFLVFNQSCPCDDNNYYHDIPPKFEKILIKYTSETIRQSYTEIAYSNIFLKLFPCYVAALLVKEDFEFMPQIIHDVSLTDLRYVDVIIRMMHAVGMSYREVFEFLIWCGDFDNLRNHLLILLDDNYSDYWDLTLEIIKKVKNQLPSDLVENIIETILQQNPIKMEVLRSVVDDIFIKEQVDVNNINPLIYKQCIQYYNAT